MSVVDDIFNTIDNLIQNKKYEQAVSIFIVFKFINIWKLNRFYRNDSIFLNFLDWKNKPFNRFEYIGSRLLSSILQTLLGVFFDVSFLL